MAISIASALIFLLKDEELVWGYSSLLVGSAYAIAAFSSYQRFRPDIVTAAFHNPNQIVGMRPTYSSQFGSIKNFGSIN